MTETTFKLFRDCIKEDGLLTGTASLTKLIFGSERPQFLKALQLRSAFRNIASNDPEVGELAEKLASLEQKNGGLFAIPLSEKYQSTTISDDREFASNVYLTADGLKYCRIVQSSELPLLRATVGTNIGINIAQHWLNAGITESSILEDLSKAKKLASEIISQIEDSAKAENIKSFVEPKSVQGEQISKHEAQKFKYVILNKAEQYGFIEQDEKVNGSSVVIRPLDDQYAFFTIGICRNGDNKLFFSITAGCEEHLIFRLPKEHITAATNFPYRLEDSLDPRRHLIKSRVHRSFGKDFKILNILTGPGNQVSPDYSKLTEILEIGSQTIKP